MKWAINLSKEEYLMAKAKLERLGWVDKTEIDKMIDRAMRDFVSHLLENTFGTVTERFILYDGYHIKPKSWENCATPEEKPHPPTHLERNAMRIAELEAKEVAEKEKQQ